MAYGLTVMSDEEANRRGDEFRASLRLSIEDYLTYEEMECIRRGENPTVEIPFHPVMNGMALAVSREMRCCKPIRTLSSWASKLRR